MRFTSRILTDISFKNSVTAWPPIELGWLLALGSLWLGGYWYNSASQRLLVLIAHVSQASMLFQRAAGDTRV